MSVTPVMTEETTDLFCTPPVESAAYCSSTYYFQGPLHFVIGTANVDVSNGMMECSNFRGRLDLRQLVDAAEHLGATYPSHIARGRDVPWSEQAMQFPVRFV